MDTFSADVMEQEADEPFAAAVDTDYSQYTAEEYAAYVDAIGTESGVYPSTEDAAGNQTAAHVDGKYEGYDTLGAENEWDDTYEEEEYAAYADGDTVADKYDGYPEQEEVDPFDSEAYWQQEQYNIAENAEEEENYKNPEIATEGEQVQTVPEARPSSPEANEPGSKSASPKKQKQKKTKQERMQLLQEQLEREEAKVIDDTTSATSPSSKGQQQAAFVPTASRLGFVAREKAKIQMHMRKLRAISRKRMPVQVRVLTEPRKHLSPMEMYFNHSSIEWVLSDVFWAAMKGDLRRVRHLVEIERVDVNDATLDPWNMQQSPLHWAAKGGSAPVIEYLLQSGANARSLDENGSYPLHLACWAGHADATLAILRATDTKDLYVRDYDAALAPLDWVNIRGHTALLGAIQKYEDAIWLPKFVEDLIRGIIRYKIKIFKELPKPARRALFKSGGLAAADTSTTTPATPATNDQVPSDGGVKDRSASLTSPIDAKEANSSPKRPKK